MSNYSMMHTVRTTRHVLEKSLIQRFLIKHDLAGISLGNYDLHDEMHVGVIHRYICYAYSDKNTELMESLCAITLIYGSLELAMQSYIDAFYANIPF